MDGIQVVAFDCDGVMFDTVQANKAFYNRILNHLGRPDMTKKQFDYANMHTADEVLAYLFSDEKLLEAAQAYRSRMSYLPFIPFMQIEPYLKILLKRLRPQYKTAIATNRSDSIGPVLDFYGLTRDFDIVVSALDVKRPKPHPEQLEQIMWQYCIDPAQMIYIGDSKLDELAARAAGVRLVAYNNLELNADYHIQGLKEVEKILGLKRSNV